ncbi:hypothetical protein G6L37_04410 [Agrobacterium rubi]|nr:hypothetical protein [Agrobacterium rubi]NTF24595.1 hypothetical protein [Agrobacterium rubi]
MTTNAPASEKTELQAHAETSRSGPFDLAFELVMQAGMPASAVIAGVGISQYFNGELGGHDLGVVLGGSAFLFASVKAMKYLAKHYPDGILAGRDEVAVPSKDEIATIKTEIAAENTDIVAELAAIEAKLEASKPGMKR